MGIKSRNNWLINFCTKKDCKNRGIKCQECVRYSKYKTLVSELNEEYKKEKK